MPSKAEVLNKDLADNECWLEHIGDSGAGQTIMSRESLRREGIPEKMIDQFLGKASRPLNFDTGNGTVPCDVSMNIASLAISRKLLA